MLSLIFRRLLFSIPVLFLVASLSFLLIRLAPGNPFQTSERAISPDVQAQLEKKYGLNGSLFQQYISYIGNLAAGNLGPAIHYKSLSVNQIVAQTLPVSMLLGGIAYTLALICGTLLGTFAAIYHNKLGDRAAMGFSLLGISMPNFVTAPLLITVVAIYWQLLPAAGWGSLDQIILPAIALSIPFTATIARLIRGSLLEVLKLDFIRTARAKGLSEFQIHFRHALKVAILPLISYSGPALAGILTGSIIIESIFGIPGIGQFFIKSISNRDPFLTAGVVLVYGVFLVLFNLLADMLYLVIDRRIEME